MAVELLDAVPWVNLLPLPGPVACYRDGAVSKWSPEGVAALAHRIAVNITVLADPRWEAFDSERGNAGVGAVAASVAVRLGRRQWSVVYVNDDLHGPQTDALLFRGVHWTSALFWPEPGCYLWAAAPGTPPGTLPPWVTVLPVAVQDRWLNGYDISTCFGAFPFVGAPKPPPPKPPPPRKDVSMFPIVLVDSGPIGEKNTSWIVTDNGLMPAEDPSVFTALGQPVPVSNGQAQQWSAHSPKR